MQRQRGSAAAQRDDRRQEGAERSRRIDRHKRPAAVRSQKSKTDSIFISSSAKSSQPSRPSGSSTPAGKPGKSRRRAMAERKASENEERSGARKDRVGEALVEQSTDDITAMKPP